MEGKENVRGLIKFNPNVGSKISSLLYDINRCRWNMSTHGYRMLFALAQNINQTDLFNEYEFPKEVIFKYLGLESTGRKHEILASTLKELMNSGLEICQVNKKNGKRTWAGSTWITDYCVSEENNNVWLRINDNARPFLFAVQQFSEVKPKHYLGLSTDTQNWFYPYLKLRVDLGKWEITIDDLRDALNLDRQDSYNIKKNRNANMNILRWVVGIEISEAAKQEQQLAKKEKRQPRLVPWDYIKDKNGKPTGTLYTISKETDLDVQACVFKSGRSYNKIVFLIRWKPEEMTPAKRKKMEEKIRNSAEMDMGGRKDVRGRTSSAAKLDEVIAEELPMTVEMTPVFHEDSEIRRMAAESMMSVEEFAKVGRFVKHPNGKWFRR